MSSGRGGAGGGGRSKGGKGSATGTAAAVAGTIGAAASAPAAAAPAAAVSAPAAAASAAEQLKAAREEFSAIKRTTSEQRDAFDEKVGRLEKQAFGEAKTAFQASAPKAPEARVTGAVNAMGNFEKSIGTRGEGLLEVSRVRQMAGMSKADFDAGALSAARNGKIVLHYHDFPTSLSAAQRAELIHDASSNTYYIGMARRS